MRGPRAGFSEMLRAAAAWLRASMSLARKDQRERCEHPRRGYTQLAPVPMSKPRTGRRASSEGEVLSRRALSQRM
jgi:hypothetical protein